MVDLLVQDIEAVLAAGAPFLFNPSWCRESKSPCSLVAKGQINPGICRAENDLSQTVGMQ